jgi:hypothetical protein
MVSTVLLSLCLMCLHAERGCSGSLWLWHKTSLSHGDDNVFPTEYPSLAVPSNSFSALVVDFIALTQRTSSTLLLCDLESYRQHTVFPLQTKDQLIQLNVIITVYSEQQMKLVCRDSSVGIATGYGLDGPGIAYLCGRHFSVPSRPALEPTQPPIQWVTGHSRDKADWEWSSIPNHI